MDFKELTQEELNNTNGGDFWDYVPERLRSFDAFVQGIQEEIDKRERWGGR